MNLILIRHGETEWNRTGRCQGVADIDLNDNGLRQIGELALSLRDADISAVYSSNLLRALRTAREIASRHGLDVRVEKDLREMDQGELEGLLFDDIRDRYAHVLREWRESPETLRLPGGEMLSQVEERAWAVFQKLDSLHSDETVVAVSHNLTITALLCRITGVGLKGFRNFNLRAASKNLIVTSNGNIEVSVLNDVSHLSPVESLPQF
ncbi:MAG TPA: histidine phosphatase family protein [Thermodesulfobacteriota bacterium]|nr:histidine phosphatase family protein [Thermodesulfobacteriota bacterium]